MERIKVSPFILLPSRQLVKAGYALTVVLMLVAAIQHYHAPVSPLTYTLELALPTFMLGYSLNMLRHWLTWKLKHFEIANLLSTDHYTKEPFGAITVAEAQGRIEKVGQRLGNTRRVINSAEEADLPAQNNLFIRNVLASDNIEGARVVLQEAIEHKQKIDEVIDQAESAHCLSIIFDHFNGKDNIELKAARKIITTARQLLQQARNLGIEKVVKGVLENDSLEAARKAVAEAQEKADLKKGVIARLENRIDQLEGPTEHLYAKLANLEELEYGTRTFNVAHSELDALILKAEAAHSQG